MIPIDSEVLVSVRLIEPDFVEEKLREANALQRPKTELHTEGKVPEPFQAGPVVLMWRGFRLSLLFLGLWGSKLLPQTRGQVRG